MVVALLLIIFFGAWAVSAGGEADLGDLVSGATAGFSGSISPESVASSQNSAATDGDSVPRLASASAAPGGAVDTWWGKAFLVACPLH
jgi:hypothetical protein